MSLAPAHAPHAPCFQRLDVVGHCRSIRLCEREGPCHYVVKNAEQDGAAWNAFSSSALGSSCFKFPTSVWKLAVIVATDCFTVVSSAASSADEDAVWFT